MPTDPLTPDQDLAAGIALADQTHARLLDQIRQDPARFARLCETITVEGFTPRAARPLLARLTEDEARLALSLFSVGLTQIVQEFVAERKAQAEESDE